jgi:hypothetical protein
MQHVAGANDLRPDAVECINEEAMRIRAEHPFPATILADLPEKQQTAWLRTQSTLVDQVLTRAGLGNLHPIPRTWVDVQLTEGRWVGRWTDHSIWEAALHTACWFDQPITAASIGLKQTTTDADRLQARIDGGELLALLGDTW